MLLLPPMKIKGTPSIIVLVYQAVKNSQHSAAEGGANSVSSAELYKALLVKPIYTADKIIKLRIEASIAGWT